MIQTVLGYLALISLIATTIVCSENRFDVKPDWIKTCRLADPEFKKCSTISVQGLFDQLVDGVEGVGIDQIDPFKVGRIKILQGDGPVSVNASLSKVTVFGFSNTKVVSNNVSPVDFSWETRIQLPKMRLEGNYHMQGRILVIPLNGHGKCWFEPSNMDIRMSTKTQLYQKDNHIYYNVTSTSIDYTISGLKLRLDNLFEGAKLLEDSTNQYLNDNWRPASEALRPIIKKTIEDILLSIMQRIFHILPAEYFVSDLPWPNGRPN